MLAEDVARSVFECSAFQDGRERDGRFQHACEFGLKSLTGSKGAVRVKCGGVERNATINRDLAGTEHSENIGLRDSRHVIAPLAVGLKQFSSAFCLQLHHPTRCTDRHPLVFDVILGPLYGYAKVYAREVKNNRTKIPNEGESHALPPPTLASR